MIAKYGWTGDGDWVWWIIPFSGSDPFPIYPLKLDVSVPGYPDPILLSPDGKKLLLSKVLDSHVLTGAGRRWSPDGKELAVISEDELILAIPIAGGKPRQIADLSGLAADKHYGLCWSPDGQKLAFYSDKYRIFTVPADGGELIELVADDSDRITGLRWSPDGKWISYSSDEQMRTRPEGTIWEADVSEFLSRKTADQ
jgi:WD40 repeat protein